VTLSKNVLLQYSQNQSGRLHTWTEFSCVRQVIALKIIAHERMQQSQQQYYVTNNILKHRAHFTLTSA